MHGGDRRLYVAARALWACWRSDELCSSTRNHVSTSTLDTYISPSVNSNHSKHRPHFLAPGVRDRAHCHPCLLQHRPDQVFGSCHVHTLALDLRGNDSKNNPKQPCTPDVQSAVATRGSAPQYHELKPPPRGHDALHGATAASYRLCRSRLETCQKVVTMPMV